MSTEFREILAAINNVNIGDLPSALTAARGRVAGLPQVSCVEMVYHKGRGPMDRVTFTDGSHIIATAADAQGFPPGRQPWLPWLDSKFRVQREGAAAAWRHYPGHGCQSVAVSKSAGAQS